MLRRATVVLGVTTAGLVVMAAVASCGARTGLPELPEADAGMDVNVIRDRFVVPDMGSEETLPGIDAGRDVHIINPCPDAAATLIYLMGISNDLYSFDPNGFTTTHIGTLDCPEAIGTPFSMAVDREGVAYVVFSNPGGAQNLLGTGLFKVSTKTARCTPTAYNASANGNVTFGMGFVANVSDGGDGGETLFISIDSLASNMPDILASIDTDTFKVTRIGPYNPSITQAELTGTGSGRLFAFSPSATPEAFIAEIDTKTAKVVAADPLPGVTQGRGWAFGFWGGEFYTFTATVAGDTATAVTQFDPVTKDIKPVAVIQDIIVGAGVSTCAPQVP